MSGAAGSRVPRRESRAGAGERRADGRARVEQSRAARGRWSGQSFPRKEDRRHLLGKAMFTDDGGQIHMGYAHFVRSPYAHARIVSIDVARAAALAGVYATPSWEAMVEELTQPYFQIAPEPGGRIAEYCLAVDKVRYQGDAVAVVLAETREIARDAAELVEVEYEPLPAVVDSIAAASPGAPLLHEQVGSNVVWHGVYDYGDVDWALENADHVVEIDRLHFHRFSSTPLECNAAVVNWDGGSGVIEIFSNNQMPMFASLVIGPALGVASNQLLFRSMDIGGAFGIKIGSYPQITALALLSRKAGRPVKWTEYRTDHMQSAGHGNERTFVDIEVPVMADGTILGFKVEAYDDAGAYLRYEPLGAVIWAQVVPGNYRFKHVQVDYTETLTNKCPTIPNRGYSRLQHLWMIERIVDIVATELGFDPVELRKRNYVQPEDYPYTTPNGCVYDSGDLPRALDLALEAIDYPRWRERQRELGTGSGRRLGIGIGTTLDSGTNNFGQSRIINPQLPFSGNGEAAFVKLDLYGEINVDLGTTPQGQSHETTAAQVVADILGCSPDMVTVSIGFDARHNTYVAFSGTYASQFAVTGLGAAMGAAEKLRAEIVKVAAFALSAARSPRSPSRDGTAFVPSSCAANPEERMIPFIGIANLVYSNVAALPGELADSVSLNCRHVYRPPFEIPDTEAKTGNLTLTYASQTHACVLEIDEETGQATILDYAVADDCGRVINPQIVTGQVHGATAHGIGAALWETFEYDEDGQLLQSSFYDYHAVTALDVPDIKTTHIESPSPFTPNGAKGMGEGGGAPLHAICSAIQDALGEGAPIVAESHNHWERIYRLLHPEPGAARGVEGRERVAGRGRVILNHEFTVEGDLETVWRTLLDLERVAGCLPGATIRATADEGRFEGSMKVKIGPMAVTYEGSASFVDINDAEHRAVISLRAREAKGQGTALATDHEPRRGGRPAGAGAGRDGPPGDRAPGAFRTGDHGGGRQPRPRRVRAAAAGGAGPASASERRRRRDRGRRRRGRWCGLGRRCGARGRGGGRRGARPAARRRRLRHGRGDRADECGAARAAGAVPAASPPRSR